MNAAINLIADFFRNIASLISKRPVSAEQRLPYFSQFESPELVLEIIEKKRFARDDPRWQESDAASQDEYEFWAWRACGMACLKMILAREKKQVIPIVALAKLCEKYGAYDIKRDNLGLIYKPFTVLVKSEFGLNARVYGHLSLSLIKHNLARGSYVIASVSGSIRDARRNPTSKGGHLVLITGYDDASRMLYINNPSGIFGVSQKNYAISERDFKKFFGGRGIVIHSLVAF